MNPVDEYIARYEGEKKEWLAAFVAFMRETFPQAEETVSYQMPMYKWSGQYIAFSLAKDHFSMHTLDFEMINTLKTLLPTAKFGKGCAKVSYRDRAAIPVLMDACKAIIDRHLAKSGK